MTARYRLEWPSTPDGPPDRWVVEIDPSSARRRARRLLRSGAPWVRVIGLDASGDAVDGFFDASTIARWQEGSALPRSTGLAPVSPPEIDRLRTRAAAGLEVVVGWAVRRGVLSRVAAEHVAVVFDAAMLGVVNDDRA